MKVNILTQLDEINDFVTNTWRPRNWRQAAGGLWVPCDEHGELAVNSRALASNAFLNKEEWERLDSAVIAMAQQKLNAYGDLVAAGLDRPSSLAVEYTKWRVASERIAADVTMDFRTKREQDRTDKKTYGVPVPIISAEYTIGRRELLVARQNGQAVDTFEAQEASKAVSEKVEDILINGNTSIVIGGNSIPGYRTLSARDTATATVYGGGDFGTLSSVRPTFIGMLTALAAKRYRGPFNCYIASTQYWQMQDRFADGSGQTGLETVEAIPEIKSVKENDLMTDGELLMVQMTGDVVDAEVALSIENRQWESPDGSELHFVVLMAVTFRLKTDYAGNAGIAHATAC